MRGGLLGSRGQGTRRLGAGVAAVALVLLAGAATAEIDLDTAASFFGKRPTARGMRMSPDGSKVVFLAQHPDDLTIAFVQDLEAGKGGIVAASDPKKGMHVTECRWASNERLLCWYGGITRSRDGLIWQRRVVAVNADGKNMKVLIQRHQRDSENWSNNQGGLVDLLPDEPRYVWMEIREKNGYGVARVDIRKNRTKVIESPKQTIWGLESDGRGQIRLRENHDRNWVDYEYRLDGELTWHELCRNRQDGESDCGSVLGFGEDPNDLLVLRPHEGRAAVFRQRLTGSDPVSEDFELVYAHPSVDVDDGVRLGKHGRVVGARYVTDVPETDYFDPEMEKIYEILSQELPTKGLEFVDESWDRRYYLVRGGSDVEPARYYRYDTETGSLARIASTYAWLDDFELARMRPITYPSAEGVTVPAYLSQVRGPASKRPLVVLPHGGPSHRDVWGFDWLAQFFASQGYLVLQPNYRGSSGYGTAWEGDGGFKRWRDVTQDIHAGVEHLVGTGQVDPDRVCLVGWSFGGYAALMTALENPGRYRCVVSIAGVTHPHLLQSSLRKSDGAARRRAVKDLLPDGDEIQQGSALKRADEMTAPVLLLHGDLDKNVDIDHSERLASALERADKPVEFVEYEDEDHGIRTKQANTIDLLQRVGDFLERHLRKKPKKD